MRILERVANGQEGGKKKLFLTLNEGGRGM